MKPADLFQQYEADMGLVCQGKTCTRQAVYILRIHAMDLCNKPLHIDKDGNWVTLCCPQCTSEAAIRAANLVRDLKLMPQEAENEHPPQCKTCKRDILGIHNLLSIEYLMPQ